MTERRKALITGASRGIGRAICVKLASEGTDIVFSYRSGDEAASETVNLCREYGIEIHAIKADVSNSEECERLIKEAVDLLGGRIDILVNNAGILEQGLKPIDRFLDEDMDRIIETNEKGTIEYLLFAKNWIDGYVVGKRSPNVQILSLQRDRKMLVYR